MPWRFAPVGENLEEIRALFYGKDFEYTVHEGSTRRFCER